LTLGDLTKRAGRTVHAGGAPRYGDRHGIWATELLSQRTWPSAPVGRSRLPEHPDVGTDTMSDMPIR